VWDTAGLLVSISFDNKRNWLLRLMIGQGIRLTLTGVTIGIAGAFSLTQVMTGLLFDVEATDPLTFVSITLLLSVVAMQACFIPARPTAKVDPVVALGCE
jgi:putative ABC transport system permease protein